MAKGQAGSLAGKAEYQSSPRDAFRYRGIHPEPQGISTKTQIAIVAAAWGISGSPSQACLMEMGMGA